jgi:hypothetical protein
LLAFRKLRSHLLSNKELRGTALTANYKVECRARPEESSQTRQEIRAEASNGADRRLVQEISPAV